MFNKKLQTQEVQVDQTLPLNDQPLPVDWTSRVQSMVYILKGARGDFVVCIMLHQKKKSPYRKKNVVVWFWHKNSQDTLWDCQRLMEATWRLLCRVVSWRIFLGEHFMLFQDAVFWRYWKSRIWWKHPLRWPLERQGESLGMTFAGHHFEPVDYDFVHQDDTLL